MYYISCHPNKMLPSRANVKPDGMLGPWVFSGLSQANWDRGPPY